MSWRATAAVTAATGVMLVTPGSAGVTPVSALSGVAAAGAYALVVRLLVGRAV